MQRAGISVLLALVALAIGFAIEASALGAAIGAGVAKGIAVLAKPLLALLGTDLVRNGVELRAAGGGWAVRVSDVCDGMGLVVALVAALVAVGASDLGWRWGLRQAALGFGAIQVFNLARVIGLTLALDHWPSGFTLLHDQVFPLLTVALIGALVMGLVATFRFFALALPLALVWGWISGWVSPWLVPGANLLLTLAPPEVGEIALRASGWSVGTLLVAAFDPLQLYVAPLEPGHFLLALPFVLGASLLGTGDWLARVVWLAVALVSMTLAMTLAAVGAVWALAALHAPASILVPDGTGAFEPQVFTPPQGARSLLSLVQNVLVHFNALVLPFVILTQRRGRRATD